MASDTLIIVTGASRGYGKALALGFSHRYPGAHFLLLSRSPCDYELPGAGSVSVCSCDLSNVDTVESDVSVFLQDLEVEEDALGRVIMLHNAGTLGPLVPVGEMADGSAIVDHINLNVTSCLLVTNVVLRRFMAAVREVVVVDISSGAATMPFETWSLYCLAKAARKMLMSVLAKESPEKVRTLSWAPGIMATDMQNGVADGTDCPTKDFLMRCVQEEKTVPVQQSVEELLAVLQEEWSSGSLIDFYDRKPDMFPKFDE